MQERQSQRGLHSLPGLQPFNFKGIGCKRKGFKPCQNQLFATGLVVPLPRTLGSGGDILGAAVWGAGHSWGLFRLMPLQSDSPSEAPHGAVAGRDRSKHQLEPKRNCFFISE
jgi:hypothetical protein